MFMNSQEGKNYYLGILPPGEKQQKIRVTRSNAQRQTKDSFANASTRRSSVHAKKREDYVVDDKQSQSSQQEME